MLSRAMWVSSLGHPPKSRLYVCYTGLKPEGVQGTAALGMVRAPGGPLQCGWNQAQKERGQTKASSFPIATFKCVELPGIKYSKCESGLLDPIERCLFRQELRIHLSE